MKKLLIVLALMAVLLLMFACAQKPEKVADKFLSAMEKNDVEAMKALSTDESVKMIDFIGMIQQESKLLVSHKIISSQVKDTLATVNYSAVISEDFRDSDDDANQEESLTLVKRDGKWKVHVEKDGMQK